MQEGKTTVRERLKTIRETLTLEERREKSYYITEQLITFLEPYQTILMYVAKDPEVETMVAINLLFKENKTVLVPIIERKTTTLRISRLKRMEDLEPGTFHVPEPLSCEEPFPPEKIEITVLPLIGFDRSGNRLGYGAGYYDRFFEKYPNIPRVGLAYSCQEAETIPTDPYDQRMQWVVTENGLIKMRGN